MTCSSRRRCCPGRWCGRRMGWRPRLPSPCAPDSRRAFTVYELLLDIDPGDVARSYCGPSSAAPVSRARPIDDVGPSFLEFEPRRPAVVSPRSARATSCRFISASVLPWSRLPVLLSCGSLRSPRARFWICFVLRESPELDTLLTEPARPGPGPSRTSGDDVLFRQSCFEFVHRLLSVFPRFHQFLLCAQ